MQTVLERSVDLSWNVDGLPADCLDPPESQIPITHFVHEILPQVTRGKISLVSSTCDLNPRFARGSHAVLETEGSPRASWSCFGFVRRCLHEATRYIMRRVVDQFPARRCRTLK